MNFTPLTDDENTLAAGVLQDEGQAAHIPIIPVPKDAPPPPSRYGRWGEASARWTYNTAEGGVACHVCRFDQAGEKTYRPQTYTNQGWKWGAIPANRPLYGLCDLLQDLEADVYLVEGEKCVDAAKKIFPNAVVVTSSGGSNAADKSDWSALKGRHVIIWRDNDAAGQRYQDSVLSILLKIDCFVEIIDVVELASLSPDGGRREPPEGWDCADAKEEWASNPALLAAVLNHKMDSKIYLEAQATTANSQEHFSYEKSKKNDAKEKPEDQLQLAIKVIRLIGSENIINTEAGVYCWQDKGVWHKAADVFLKKAVQRSLFQSGNRVSSSLVNGVTEVLKTEIFKARHIFNLGNPETINCLNGEIELVEGKWVLTQHRREHYRTTQIPVLFDPTAVAPKFRIFLNDIFINDPDKEEKIKSLLEMLGYSLVSHTRHEKFVILIGAGANGKSVLLGILHALCGSENVAGVQPSNFGNSFQRAHLEQKLVNIVTEIAQGEVIADAELKGITSGEPSTVEHKYGAPFVMTPYSTCWFGSNHMPRTKDFSDALFRRAIIIPFNRIFQKTEQNPNLKEELKAELPGILNLALNAYAEALAHGFTEAPSSLAAKQEWRLEVDQVAQFVSEKCEYAPKEEILFRDLFTAYTSWAAHEGVRLHMAAKGFSERLGRLGFGKRHTATSRYITGIRLAQNEDDFG
ncbi:MAG: hypothetical protein EB015_13835 [Methylocystaceae bacterium]|nr:hypothetical protein [Methylocystaceae bacterium]